MRYETNRIAKAVLAVALILLTQSVATAQSVGGGISVRVPMDMLQGETGSISFETSLETSLGIGPFLSIPVGFAYNQIYGSSVVGMVRSSGEDLETSGPWFYSDSLLPYVMLQVHIPAGPAIFDIFGGGAANYNFSLRPFHDRIARDLRDAGALGATGGDVAVTDLSIESGLGWGWVAGAAAGLTFGDISVSVNATYRHILHDLTITGRSFRPDGTTGRFDTGTESFAIEELRILTNGISIGIGGSFAM
jgi:hypothetical protein